MDELEEIRRRKLEKLQDQFQQESADEEDFQKQVSSLEQAVKARLTKEALERYGNVKLGHPDKALQLLAVIAKLIQMNRLKGIISDEQLREILGQLTPEKKEFKFRRV